ALRPPLSRPAAAPSPVVPIAIAVADAGVTAAQPGERLLDRIVASGPASGAWVDGAKQVFTDLRRLVPPALASQVEFTSAAWYRQACVLEAVCTDSAAYDRLNRLFLDSDPFNRWTGMKGRTPAESRTGDSVGVSWLLMNPGDWGLSGSR